MCQGVVDLLEEHQSVDREYPQDFGHSWIRVGSRRGVSCHGVEKIDDLFNFFDEWYCYGLANCPGQCTRYLVTIQLYKSASLCIEKMVLTTQS